jgi:hypothetical protein
MKRREFITLLGGAAAARRACAAAGDAGVSDIQSQDYWMPLGFAKPMQHAFLAMPLRAKALARIAMVPD